MRLESFLAKSRIIDLKSADFEEALNELVEAVPDSFLCGEPKREILKELAERENSMSTYLGNCVCLPHLRLKHLSRKYVFVVGRCPNGLRLGGKEQYSSARILFLILAQAEEPSYLQVLSSLARILSDDETIARLVAPMPIKAFQERIFEAFAGTDGLRDKVRRMNRVFLTRAENIARECGCTAVVVMGDTFTNGIRLANYFKGMRVVLVSERRTDADFEEFDEIVSVRSYSRIRMGQLKSAVLVGITKGILQETDKICCIGGIRGSDSIDSIIVFNVGAEFSQFYLKTSDALPAGVKPDVVERVIDIATELAVEGREGKPVGSLFIIGDIEHLRPYLKQLVLNPFAGYKPEDRNVLSPFMDETVKEFSLIDGAFVIDGSGTLEAAGALVHTPDFNLKLPGGLGARHAAAYSISLAADCLAFVVSSSTGQLSLFRKGQMVILSEPRS
ncbi:MAG: PTS sugar transporter subunit IIA [Opitutales bacterium]|nr:PTS sugar transporter subunit IIA [Opitutales bacterium]